MPPLHYWLYALHLPDIGPSKFLDLLELFPDITALFQASDATLRYHKIHDNVIAALKNPIHRLIEKERVWAEKADHHIITFDDPAYPSLLKQIPTPPLVLFVRGNKAALQQPQIAIVGARHATPVGMKNAEIFAKHLAEAGVAITSGLALGIDGAAHRGALAAGGITIGVCGTGLNHIYPKAHHKLYAEILANQGAIISEFLLDEGPNAYHFPKRNLTIAGMSMGVVVIEAAMKSGSLITARLAVEHNRDVFAVPGSIHNPLARGCHKLIKEGGAKLVETADDILKELTSMKSVILPQSEEAKPHHQSTLLPTYRALLHQIDYETTPFDVIHLRSQLTAGEVSSILLVLELQGLIISTTGGYQRIAAT